MKQFICIPLFLFISLLGFSQKHSIGLNLTTSTSFLEHISPIYQIFPFNPSIELSYIYQRTEKTAIASGVGMMLQFLYSDNLDINGRLQIDAYYCTTIPIEYRYSPVKWFYVGTGINNKVRTFFNASTPPDLPKHFYFLEAVGSTGVQFDLKKFTYRFGLYTEVPLIHREYVNFGAETGLYFNF